MTESETHRDRRIKQANTEKARKGGVGETKREGADRK